MAIVTGDDTAREILDSFGLSIKDVTSIRIDFVVDDVATITVKRTLHKENLVKLKILLEKYALVRLNKNGRGKTAVGKAIITEKVQGAIPGNKKDVIKRKWDEKGVARFP